MRNEKLRLCSVSIILLLGMQSLADVAQKEAERRRQLEQQGVESKVIERKGTAIESTAPESPTRNDEEKPSKSRTLRSYRSALQKLDRAIRQNEIKLETLRAKLQSEKWPLPKIGRMSGSSSSPDKLAKLQEQISALQVKIQQDQNERSDIYQSGKKDGFLPGELDGKGIIP
jgi:hypothetical protein